MQSSFHQLSVCMHIQRVGSWKDEEGMEIWLDKVWNTRKGTFVKKTILVGMDVSRNKFKQTSLLFPEAYLLCCNP